MEIPITSHPKLPDEVPLVADFHDDRNRLSYYYLLLKDVANTPITHFAPVDGDFDSHPQIEYRDVTRFMQEISTTQLFVRSDFTSGKFDGDSGSKICSQDPYEIETVVLELLRQISRSKRHIGGRLAFREWIPHDTEVRYFIRNGEVLYRDSVEDIHGVELPDEQAKAVAERFTTFSWSVDFIRHAKSGTWYCTDMGLDGLYHNGKQWIAISEHLDESHSPERKRDEMPNPERLLF